MDDNTKSDLIIKDFRYAQSQLRKQAADLKDQEARLFRKLLDDLQTIHYSQCADPHCLRVEHAGALE